MYIETRDSISTFKDSSSDAVISTLLLYPKLYNGFVLARLIINALC